MTKEFDILSFNSVETANTGEELELFHKGATTGIFLQVQGAYADAVKIYQKEVTKELARKQKFAEKKGNDIDFLFMLIDKREQRDAENAANRVIGWRGANGTFDKDKLKTALLNNPQWIDEIIDLSDAMGK